LAIGHPAPFSARALHVRWARTPDAALFGNRFSARALHWFPLPARLGPGLS